MNDAAAKGAGPKLTTSRRQRPTPYTSRIEALGVSDYSVVNHTILPKGFGRSVEEDYWHLRSHVQLWDVGCQRQVELHGPDAPRLLQMMTPRDLRGAEVGQCLYAPLIDEAAGMINDPVILKLDSHRFWLSIADSDVLLWAKGLALGFGLDVAIDEPDVWPLSVQGPKADDVMARVFGDEVRAIRFFDFKPLDFQAQPVLVARSGYSRQDGFEIYPYSSAFAPALWDELLRVGADFNILPSSPNMIDRIEAGFLSYGNEMTRQNNPLECGLERYCRLDGSIEFIGREALLRIAEVGPERIIRGVLFDGERCPACADPWPVSTESGVVGQITSAIWSPRLNQNVALGMLERGYWQPGTRVAVDSGDGVARSGVVTALPFE